jgi:hypothetical protein
MRLCKAVFHGVRGLPDLTWDLTRAGAPVEIALVTGGPASGKTRVLEAIIAAKEVIAAYGPPRDGQEWLRPGDAAARIELDWALDAEERRRAGGAPTAAHTEALFRPRACAAEVDDAIMAVLETYEHDPAHGKLDYYPANRVLPPPGPMHGLHAIEQRLYRLGRDPRKYSFVARFLYDLAREPARRARFAEALAAFCPTLRFVEPDDEAPLRCLSGRGRGPLLPSELSSVEADALIFVVTASLIRHDRSILIVDRPEISADERHIAAWLGALRRLSPGAQIILATASPALLAAAEAGSMLDLDA